MTETTVDVIGDGSPDDPRRPDIEGGYRVVEYHEDGTVTVETSKIVSGGTRTNA